MVFIPYGRQHIGQDDIDFVVNVLKSDWLTQGPVIKEFEDAVSAYHGCKHAVAFCNGTAALHGAYYVSTKFPFGKKGKVIQDVNELMSWKKPTLTEFDKFRDQYWEFITTPNTFAASANGGLYCNGSPRFTDIDLSNYCIDIGQIEDFITEDTRVITPVSYAGYPVDIKAIKNLPKVKEYNICIIHDACHAIGARRDGRSITDDADMTILSFHPVKHITTGEGGMVLTNNEEYYKKLLLFRNHGITKDTTEFKNQPDGAWYYEMQELGYNYRITDIQCALGVSQMKKLDEFLYRRNEIAKIYEDELIHLNWLSLPPGFKKTFLNRNSLNSLVEKPDNLHSYHLFPIMLNRRIDRRNFFDYLRENGIGAQIHYIPVCSLGYYREYSLGKNAESYYSSTISLPIYMDLNSEMLTYVIEKIKGYNA